MVVAVEPGFVELEGVCVEGGVAAVEAVFAVAAPPPLQPATASTSASVASFFTGSLLSQSVH